MVNYLALTAVEILFVFFSKTKRLERKAGKWWIEKARAICFKFKKNKKVPIFIET
jgi:hypothetical protein